MSTKLKIGQCGFSYHANQYIDTGHQSSLRNHVIHTCCQLFGGGTVTTCFNYIGLLQPGFEHSDFHMQVKCSTNCITTNNRKDNLSVTRLCSGWRTTVILKIEHVIYKCTNRQSSLHSLWTGTSVTWSQAKNFLPRTSCWSM